MRTFRSPALLIVVCGWASALGAVEVPVLVKEPAGIGRKAEPISGGISLPRGLFKPGEVQLALFDKNKPVPAQVSELVVGPNGFVRWVLLDFQLDLGANGTKELLLRTGRPVPPERPLKVKETAEAVHVDTGRMALTIRRNRPFTLLENVTVEGKAMISSGQISYTDGLVNKRYFAGAGKVVTVHYAGPLRVTVEVRGSFEDDESSRLTYRTFITAWAGRTDILVKHRLINSRQEQRYLTKIKGSRIELKPANARERVTVGAEAAIELDLGGGDVLLHQGLEEKSNREIPSAKLTESAKVLWSGRGAQGWISTGRIWAADRLFRTDPPRLLGVLEDGTLVLDAAPRLFEGQRQKNGALLGRPYACQDEYRWLYDCSAHSSEYRIDFDAPTDHSGLELKARSAAARVWAFAPGDWYSQCEVLGAGKFGTLADEKACHAEWKWAVGAPPELKCNPRRFVGYEDNHYESEADSTEALLLMFLRTGKRGFFDEAEAWARYHSDVQAWRTEGWQWKDGGIWWPQGGPPGNRPVRAKANLDFAGWNKGTDADRTLWRTAMAKGCYCHFYGAGLVDWFCLTGDREALLAAIDNCETKLDEFTHYRNFVPGESALGSTRGFGRGFYVAVRTWMVEPHNPILRNLVRLCRETFVKLPDEYLDERGVYAVVAGKLPERYLTDGIKEFMADQGITVNKSGTFQDRAGDNWKWRDIGGTWMIAYIQHACNLLAEQTEDEDMTDYVIASGRFTAKFMLSQAAKQTWYYTALDIPERGDIWDDWKYDGQRRNELGEGPRHSGWYTRFFPDCLARAYSWTGETRLLEKGREFWSFGNRRRYQSTKLTEKHNFAHHVPPKDDSVLSTSRLFYECSHPRQDTQPPAAIKDLTVRLLGNGRAKVGFTAPVDIGGKPAKYQVKVAAMPILPYEQWDYRRDSGKKCNWWRAINCKGEPSPKASGAKESFVASNVPDMPGEVVFFAVRSFDDSGNRSDISNVFKTQ